ncbi:Uncharacterised protein [Vibrio cholerae]|nr:Uncharacterised protein [Vibrio cholerae]
MAHQIVADVQAGHAQACWLWFQPQSPQRAKANKCSLYRVEQLLVRFHHWPLVAQ